MNSQLQDIQGQEGGGKCLWNLSELLQGTTGHHGAKAKSCQRHFVYICDAEDTLGWGRHRINPKK